MCVCVCVPAPFALCISLSSHTQTDIFSAMIPQAEGTALIEVTRDGEPAQGLLVPMNCKKNSGIGDSNQQCHPAVRADRELVDSLALVRSGWTDEITVPKTN